MHEIDVESMFNAVEQTRIIFRRFLLDNLFLAVWLFRDAYAHTHAYSHTQVMLTGIHDKYSLLKVFYLRM